MLLLENCSSHGSTEPLPTLCGVTVLFLTPKTTSKIQPMDAGDRAEIKMRYRSSEMERAIVSVEEKVRDK